MNILVLCTGNSCRSQIAEGYLRHFLGERARVYSAGIERHGVNPRALLTMLADGIDISEQTSNLVDEYVDIDFDHVLTVCDHAAERCPLFVSKARRWHHSFADPAKAQGREEEIMREFARVREEIRAFAESWAKEILNL